MWQNDSYQSNSGEEDVQVIEISNEIELLPDDCDTSRPYLKEEICKNILSQVKENVNKLHLQSVKNRLNLYSNAPEVDVEYKVTNGSLSTQKKGDFTIENVEINKKIKQENDDEIQASVIQIQNNNMTFVEKNNCLNKSLNDERFNMRESILNSNYHHNDKSLKDSGSELRSSSSFDDNVNQNNAIDLNLNRQKMHRDQSTVYQHELRKHHDRQMLKKHLQDTVLETRMKPVVKIDLTKRFEASNIYPICSRPRGFCLIINNVDFIIYEKRNGSDLEAKYLQEIFRQLDFEVIYYRNMTSLGMLECFKNIVRRPELENHDAFISIILTHGDDSKVLIGTDAMRLKVDSFLQLFTDANCPHLANKPKIFFIQACRGENHDFGIYDQTVSDAVPVRMSNSKARQEVKDSNRLNDVLIVNSTLDGFVSLRNEISGSWFGDALSFALCAHSSDMELHQLLLYVNRKILEREKGDIQQAIECNYICFKRKFYFNPGHFFAKKTTS